MDEEFSDYSEGLSTRRAHNFTLEEISLLVNLVDKFKSVVLHKSTNLAANQLKDRAWGFIEELFNKEGFEIIRSEQVLRKKWGNLKIELKKSSKSSKCIDDTLRKISEIVEFGKNYSGAIVLPEGYRENTLDNISNGDDLSDSEISKKLRSINFSPEEISLLLNLIEKYADPVLLPSILADVKSSKNKAWSKLTNEFNIEGKGCQRTVDMLRNKWRHLKETLDLSKTHLDERSNHVFKLLQMSKDMNVENKNNKVTKFQSSDDETLDSIKDKSTDTSTKSISRSSNFSPDECGLLLKCVKEEKKSVFSKNVHFKKKAWEMVTKRFNKQSPVKRTAPILRNKFYDMKSMANVVRMSNPIRRFSNGYKNMLNEKGNDDLMKEEPSNEFFNQTPSDFEDNRNCVDFENNIDFDNDDSAEDPLCTVLNDESLKDSYNRYKHKDFSELIEYELETAKLKRKKIEDAIKFDESEREARLLERSMRLRAARLNVVAAEMKLPSNHPALNYLPEEERGRGYCLNTNGHYYST